MSTSTVATQEPPVISTLAVRTRLMLLCLAGIVLALLSLRQALTAYQTSHDLFTDIADVNRTKVDAAEVALQYLASSSQATADYTALNTNTPLYEKAQSTIFQDFNRFRDEMFILRSYLQSDEERQAYTVADVYSFNRFWRHVANLVEQRTNLVEARRHYLSADNHVRNQITPALQELENINFQQMVQAGDQAESDIYKQIIRFVLFALVLAGLLTSLSFWMRVKMRRYLTPGLDIAMVASWLLLVIIVTDMSRLPGKLDILIEDSYLSVSGSSRVLVLASQANRAESSAIIDSGRASHWYTLFNDDSRLLELRICGQPACLEQPFITSNGELNPSVVAKAKAISGENSKLIGGMRPLLANITFDGEAQALENARLAYNDYLAINTEMRTMVQVNELDSATILNTGTDVGQSEEAFQRFTTSMEDLRSINRAVFDDVWEKQDQDLSRHRTAYGVVGYLIVMLTLVSGTYHRFREL